VHIVLVSTYELGHQPFGLASPQAWLLRAGHEVTPVDVSKTKLSDDLIRRADAVAFSLPMHTATRLAIPVIERVQRVNPAARIACYGLYAPLNAELLKSLGVEATIGGEFEDALVSWAESTWNPDSTSPCENLALTAPAGRGSVDLDESSRLETEPRLLRSGPIRLFTQTRNGGDVPKLTFIKPNRGGLTASYAQLRTAAGSKIVAYTEASRGCKHLCRHCPIVPVYQGQFRIVQRDVILADIRQQIAQGASHVTFGDPDFLNGPTHAMRVIETLHAEFPRVTYDATIKIEHLLKHHDLLRPLRDSGCLFVTTAVESLDDAVLAKLEKNHTRRDFFEAVALAHDAQLALQPTFLAFTPWTTLDTYRDLLRVLRDLDLVESVPSVQLALRLLITSNSRLLELDDIRSVTGPFDKKSLVYPWTHPDARVDALGARIFRLVDQLQKHGLNRTEIFAAIWNEAGDDPLPKNFHLMPRAVVPYLDEPWYC
jgi:radical SAM superfamily enzyme YgiQ (UPF0313 family)